MGSGRPVARLLDASFGFFVGAAHLLVVYVAAAVACVLGLGAAAEGTRAAFVATLAGVTVAAATVVILHALRRYWQQRDIPEQRFRMKITVGNDAIAFVAIGFQLFPILLIPVCA